jgi:cytochrome c oxidase assembly factor CtaG
MKACWKKIAIAAVLTSAAIPALGHEEEAPQNFHELIRDWEFDPLVVLGLFISGWFYWRGTRRLWKTLGTGRGIRKWEAGSFWAGWFSLVAALISPLHALGHALFSAHMVQHEILMLISAPLFVLGRPMIAVLKAFPTATAQRLARWAHAAWWEKFWRTVTYPPTAWLIHGLALWIWHIPFLFQATLDNDFVHSLQHISFLFSALLFWWALMHGRARMKGYGLAVLYVFTTAMHTGALGALITFAGKILYPEYVGATMAWHLTPLEDQQLGGLIMWIPAGLVYVGAGLALFAAWMRESEARVKKYQSELHRDPLFKLPPA